MAYKEVKINEAVRIRLTDPVGTYWVMLCDICGCPAYDIELHDNWHREVSNL